MKRLIIIALAGLALAAVPSALADTSPAPAAPAQQPADGSSTHRGKHLQLKLKIAERRFRKHCGTTADSTSERCLDAAKKAAERLAALDAKLKARIAEIQSACTASSTDDSCKNADERVARLQKLEARIAELAAKVQAAGTTS